MERNIINSSQSVCNGADFANPHGNSAGILPKHNCMDCSQAVREGGLVYYIKDSGKLLCRRCVARLNENDGDASQLFVVHGDNMYPLLDANSIDALENYVYSFEYNGKYSYITGKHNQKSAGKLLADGSNQLYLFEKNDGRCMTILPPEEYVNSLEYSEKPHKKLDELMSRIKLGWKENRLICDDSGRIVGFTSKERVTQDTSDDEMQSFILWKNGWRVVSLDTLKKFYASIAINRETQRLLKKFTPQDMLNFFKDRFIGNEAELIQVVYLLYHYLEQIACGKPFKPARLFITSISGTGKTEIFRALRDYLKMFGYTLPIVQVDLSQITETGFKGADSDEIVEKIQEVNKETGGYAICFLDEADKKLIPSYSSGGIDVNKALQGNLLTLIEGRIADGGFDTGKTMFIFLGAFQELRSKKADPSGYGYAFSLEDTNEKLDDELTLEDMIEYGMQEELAGRIDRVINFHRVSGEDMPSLIKCKASELSKEYGITIQITDSAVEDFCKTALGSRGVRPVISKIRELADTQSAISLLVKGIRLNPHNDIIVIDSADYAHIEYGKSKETLNKAQSAHAAAGFRSNERTHAPDCALC